MSGGTTYGSGLATGERPDPIVLPREIAPGLFWLGHCMERLLANGSSLHLYNCGYLISGEKHSALIETGMTCDELVVMEQAERLIAERGLPDDLVRISAGVEDAGDLLRDLEAAFIETAGELGLEGAPPRGRAEESLARAAKGREQELEAQVALLKAELARAARTGASTR